MFIEKSQSGLYCPISIEKKNNSMNTFLKIKLFCLVPTYIFYIIKYK